MRLCATHGGYSGGFNNCPNCLQPDAVQADKVKLCCYCEMGHQENCRGTDCLEVAKLHKRIAEQQAKIAELETDIKEWIEDRDRWVERYKEKEKENASWQRVIVESLQADINELEIKLASKCEYHVEYGSPIDKQFEEHRLQIQAQKKIIDTVLALYAKHASHCGWHDKDECTCGFDSALQSAAELDKK